MKRTIKDLVASFWTLLLIIAIQLLTIAVTVPGRVDLYRNAFYILADVFMLACGVRIFRDKRAIRKLTDRILGLK